jgi:hypothetical protein
MPNNFFDLRSLRMMNGHFELLKNTKICKEDDEEDLR